MNPIKISNMVATALTVLFMVMGTIDPYYGTVMCIYFLDVTYTR